MSIVERIKIFMDSENISNSTFADKTGIPRPSVSQMLHGRNKKISHEVLDKIHTVFPYLSINWLMFGEGEMLSGSNIKISEGENQAMHLFADSESPDNEGDTEKFEQCEATDEINAKKNDSKNTREITSNTVISPAKSAPSENKQGLGVKPIKKISIFFVDGTSLDVSDCGSVFWSL